MDAESGGLGGWSSLASKTERIGKTYLRDNADEYHLRSFIALLSQSACVMLAS